jgi:hypothetical protein
MEFILYLLENPSSLLFAACAIAFIILVKQAASRLKGNFKPGHIPSMAEMLAEIRRSNSPRAYGIVLVFVFGILGLSLITNLFRIWS